MLTHIFPVFPGCAHTGLPLFISSPSFPTSPLLPHRLSGPPWPTSLSFSPTSSSSSYTVSCRPSQAMLTLLSGWLIARWIVVNSLANDWRERARRREEQSGARLESNRLMYECRLLPVAEVNIITLYTPPSPPPRTHQYNLRHTATV